MKEQTIRTQSVVAYCSISVISVNSGKIKVGIVIGEARSKIERDGIFIPWLVRVNGDDPRRSFLSNSINLQCHYHENHLL